MCIMNWPRRPVLNAGSSIQETGALDGMEDGDSHTHSLLTLPEGMCCFAAAIVCRNQTPGSSVFECGLALGTLQGLSGL
jgi:hypothetical protein